jgi:hypothetical protein
MSKVFVPRLDILPDAQRQLWLELAQTLKAIAYHADPALKALPQTVRNYLSEAAHNTDPTNLPVLKPLKVRGQKP